MGGGGGGWGGRTLRHIPRQKNSSVTSLATSMVCGLSSDKKYSRIVDCAFSNSTFRFNFSNAATWTKKANSAIFPLSDLVFSFRNRATLESR